MHDFLSQVAISCCILEQLSSWTWSRSSTGKWGIYFFLLFASNVEWQWRQKGTSQLSMLMEISHSITCSYKRVWCRLLHCEYSYISKLSVINPVHVLANLCHYHVASVVQWYVYTHLTMHTLIKHLRTYNYRNSHWLINISVTYIL
jgi:hypothetical protein